MSPDQIPIPPSAGPSAERLRRRGTRIAILFVVFMLVVLGVGAWQLAQSQSNAREQLRDTFASRSVIASGVLDSIFTTIFNGSRTSSDAQFGGEVTTAQLAAYTKQSSAAYTMVLTSDGTLVAASPGAPDQPEAGLIDSALQSETGLALGDTQGSGSDVVVSSAVVFANGKRVLVTASPLKAYQSFLSGSLANLVPAKGDEAYVIDGNGASLGSVSHDHPKTPPEPSLGLAQSASRNATGFIDQGGERYFASTLFPNTGWHVVVSEPTSTLYRSASGTSRWLPWVILAVLGLALLSIGALVRRTLAATAEIAVVNSQLEASQDRLRERALELQSSNAELQRSNAELEQFAYVASHDLSAPLRAVAGFSQLLGVRYKGKLDDDADQFIRHMQDGVDRMQRIIDDLLTYSRVDRSGLRPEPIDLDAILDEVLQSLGPDIAERGASVTRDRLGAACGEGGQLSQVLQNLIANGMKFTADGVTPEVHVSTRREGDRVHVSVRDNGIGVDPSHIEQIFKMFQRLHSAEEYEGTGIGLAIAKKIVERHGGDIDIAPAPGGTGTVFSFDIPAEMPR